MNDWVQRAVDLGAEAAKFILPDQVVVAEWVRFKCQYGCGGYAAHLTCPPHSPTPDRTTRLLSEYHQAVLLRVEGVGPDEEVKRRKLNQAAVALERELFLAGYYRAWAMSSGPCLYCEDCAVNSACRFPELARPSMEACGIDVYATVRQAGWEIEVVPTTESSYRFFALVLVE